MSALLLCKTHPDFMPENCTHHVPGSQRPRRPPHPVGWVGVVSVTQATWRHRHMAL